jgi:hypothetical protein
MIENDYKEYNPSVFSRYFVINQNMAYFSNICIITHEQQNSYLEMCMNAKLNP